MDKSRCEIVSILDRQALEKHVRLGSMFTYDIVQFKNFGSYHEAYQKGIERQRELVSQCAIFVRTIFCQLSEQDFARKDTISRWSKGSEHCLKHMKSLQKKTSSLERRSIRNRKRILGRADILQTKLEMFMTVIVKWPEKEKEE